MDIWMYILYYIYTYNTWRYNIIYYIIIIHGDIIWSCCVGDNIVCWVYIYYHTILRFILYNIIFIGIGHPHKVRQWEWCEHPAKTLYFLLYIV